MSESLTILIVDDDPGHCELLTRNFRRAGISNEMVVVHSGDEALDFVFRRGAFESRPGGGELLILLDVNMPGELRGPDVLRAVKSNPATKFIPVIMLTTTDDPREINQCYELGCSVCITKPVDPSKFVEAIKRLGLLLAVVRLPTERARPSIASSGLLR